jgi:hypothetical protein
MKCDVLVRFLIGFKNRTKIKQEMRRENGA